MGNWQDVFFTEGHLPSLPLLLSAARNAGAVAGAAAAILELKAHGGWRPTMAPGRTADLAADYAVNWKPQTHLSRVG